MSTPIPGRIYLADQRHLSETATVRRYSVFNTGSFYREHQQPLGTLQQLDDVILAAAQSTTFMVSEAAYHLLLPITGEVSYQENHSYTAVADAGQLLVRPVQPGTQVVLSNPYPANWVNYLQLLVHLPSGSQPIPGQLLEFDLEAWPNQLVNITGNGWPFRVSIGRFGGRQETVYTLQSSRSQLLAFVIAGAFEMEGRLLHERDSLALWDTAHTELEALSNNAVILLIEVEA